MRITSKNRQGIIWGKHFKMISLNNSRGISCVIHKSPMVVSLRQNWQEESRILNLGRLGSSISELQTHPNLHSPVWGGQTAIIPSESVQIGFVCSCMAGIAQVWGYKFGVFYLCHSALISPYSNGAVRIRVGLELADARYCRCEWYCGRLIFIHVQHWEVISTWPSVDLISIEFPLPAWKP